MPGGGANPEGAPGAWLFCGMGKPPGGGTPPGRGRPPGGGKGIACVGEPAFGGGKGGGNGMPAGGGKGSPPGRGGMFGAPAERE
jgi:hypothetical protein